MTHAQTLAEDVTEAKKVSEAKIKRQIAELFDEEFYLQNNADVAANKIDPLEHYLHYGWREGRDPSASFSTHDYLELYPELAGGDICPLIDAARRGYKVPDPAEKAAAAGRAAIRNLADFASSRQGHAASDPADAAAAAPKTDPNEAPNDYFQRVLSLIGLPQDIRPEILTDGILNGLFDPETHRGDDDADLTAGELLLRYVMRDMDRGIPPGPLFDTEYYLARAAEAGLPPCENNRVFRHWHNHGRKARIAPTPIFDEDDYVDLNRDLTTYPGWVFDHYAVHGLKEGRQSQRTFTLARTRFDEQSAPGSFSSPQRTLLEVAKRPGIAAEIDKMRRFVEGDLRAIVAETAKLDPEAGLLTSSSPSLLPPWHDRAFLEYGQLCRMIPEGDYDFVVMMPFCKTGGSDYVSAVLANQLTEQGKVLILRTQESEWAEPQWFSDQIVSVDLSTHLTMLDQKSAISILFVLLRSISPRAVFNINSRLTFGLFERFGARLSPQMALFSYYFCADRNKQGVEAGYPVQKFANVLPFLDAALVDTQSLADTLCERYMLTPDLRRRVLPIMTPAMSPVQQPPVVEGMLQTATSRRRPRIVWAGRFDRQKRFDFALQIAAEMPEVDFDFYGKAVLDAPPDLTRLPANVTINGPFKSYDELDLGHADGWLYTSAWDGLPTILIELAAQGVPIVASAVGGVPELIDETTGWPVDEDAGIDDYAARIKDMLRHPDQRRGRVSALQARVAQRHSRTAFSDRLASAMSPQAASPTRGSND